VANSNPIAFRLPRTAALFGVASSAHTAQPPPSPPAPKIESPPPAELERPPLMLQGTAIGKPRDIALVLDEATKGSVRLHVGEATEGWCLRSVDQRTVTVEKDSRIMVLSLPAPGAAPQVRLPMFQTDQTNLGEGTTAGRAQRLAPTGFP
jgi:hypothetical protein